MGAKALRQFKPARVRRRAQTRHDDATRARLFRRDHAGEALLSRALNHDGFADAQFALQIGPFYAIAQRQGHGGQHGGHGLRHAMEHRIGMQILMRREAAPQARPNRHGGRAIAHGVGAVERVGLVAEAEFLLAAIAAMAAGQIFLQRDAVALLQAKPSPGVASQTLDAAHGFMAQHQRALGLRIFQIIGPVAAADPGHLDAQQARIRSDVG